MPKKKTAQPRRTKAPAPTSLEEEVTRLRRENAQLRAEQHKLWTLRDEIRKLARLAEREATSATEISDAEFDAVLASCGLERKRG